MSKRERKALIIDTSILLHDPTCIDKFGDNIIIIPIWAIEELDGKKKSPDQVGENSRHISRLLDDYRQEGSLKNGVPTKNGGVLIIDYNGTDFNKLPVSLERNRDNRILLVAMAWKDSHPRRPQQQGRSKKNILTPELTFSEVSIITKDMNLRLKADACGINAEDYKNDKRVERVDLIYSGISKFELSDQFSYLLDGTNEIWKTNIIPAENLSDEITLDNLLPNQCCYLNILEKRIHTIFLKDEGLFKIVKTPPKNNGRVVPTNIEQALFHDMAMNPNIAIATAGGIAGTGKTLMALAAGYEQLGKKYEQLLVYRPNCQIGQDLGFLPGDIGEKFSPWMQPIFDNMHLIIGKRYEDGKDVCSINGCKNKEPSPVSEMIREGLLEVAPINFIRGRSINDCYILVDEAQNMTPHEAKTIISRAGSGTKIVFTGDVMQIDNPHVDSISNGLAHTIECMKGVSLFGHVTLTKSERSALAELAANRM